MRQKTNKLTKIIFPILCMLVFACLPMSLAFSTKHVYAATSTSDYETVTISNANFDSSSGGYLQTSPSGWTAIDQANNVKMGVISVNKDKFSNNKSSYGLEKNPESCGTSSSDESILMINAEEKYAKSGFESSSSISLDANSFYIVKVNVKTSESSSASIYIDGLVDEYNSENCYESVEFLQWKKLTFFIKTSSTKKDVKIQMYLGSKTKDSTSAVFFDNIEFYKASQNFYETELAQQIGSNSSIEPSKQTYREINVESDDIDITNNVTENANFDNATLPVFSPVFDTDARFVNISTDAKYSNFSANNKYAFSIKNEESFSCYEIKNIKIPAYGVYALSIDAKIIKELSSSNATLKLVESDDIKDQYSSYEPKSVELNISNNSNAMKNDFNTYTFFVKGNGLVDTKFSFQVSLGTSEEKITGEIALDDIKFVSTTSSQMKAASGSFQKTLELSLASSSPLVSNGHFNEYEVEEAVEFVDGNPNYAFPFGVKSWTNEVDANVNKDNIAFGIINTESTKFNSSVGTTNPLNPGYDTNSSNNILMFSNKVLTHQSAALSSISLDASSIYELTFDVKTRLDKGSMGFSVLSNDKAISSFSSISTNDEWKSYKVAIRTNAASISIGVKFDFGTEKQNASGFGFVDNVRLVKKTLTDEQFLALKNASNTKIVDFEKGNWNIVGDSSNEFGVFELVTASTTLANSKSFAGVVAGKDNEFGVTSANETNMLVVSNPEQGTSSITTKNDFHFASGKFYKVSINILTKRVAILEQNDDEEKIAFGASIKLSGFDATLENIVTNDKFKTFVFLVKATEDSDQGLTLTLSSPTSSTLGTVFADNLVVEELEESLFNEAVEQKNAKNQTNVALAQTQSQESDASNDEEESVDSGLTSKEIWLLVPSVIFGVMVIFAILAFTLRHIKIKKFAKATQANYNRRSSLDHEKARIEAKKNIDKQIAEQVELKNIIENELKTLEETYQKDLQDFRASGSTSNKMEKEFKSYMNEKSKLDATLSSVNEKIKQLENPELLVLEEKKIFLKYQKEQEKVERQIKKQTKKLEKDKKKNNK